MISNPCAEKIIDKGEKYCKQIIGDLSKFSNGAKSIAYENHYVGKYYQINETKSDGSITNKYAPAVIYRDSLIFRYYHKNNHLSIERKYDHYFVIPPDLRDCYGNIYCYNSADNIDFMGNREKCSISSIPINLLNKILKQLGVPRE